jgi:Arc/MetJ-type ribon-helix-helix transcriptional regulator
MRSLTVRLPDQLVKEIEEESREGNCPKSDIVRKRLQRRGPRVRDSSKRLNSIKDLIGSVDGLPADLSSRKKRYLKALGYGKKPAR